MGPLNVLAQMGWSGVDLFFVLSGFLITGILIDKKGRPNWIRNFFVRRVLRIFPIYYLSLIIILLISFTSYWPYAEQFQSKQIWYWTYTQNFLFSASGFPKGLGLLNHFWSLAVEEHFYLFWPFVVLLFKKEQLKWFCLVVIIVALSLRIFDARMPFNYVHTLCRMDALAFGALAVLLFKKWKANWNNNLLGTFTVSAILFLALLLFKADMHHYITHTIGYSVTALFFSCLLLLILSPIKIGETLNRLFCFSPLRFLGKYSYGIYIWHWILYNIVYTSLLKNHTTDYPWLILPFTLLIILFSLGSYELFEKHFLKLKRHFP